MTNRIENTLFGALNLLEAMAVDDAEKELSKEVIDDAREFVRIALGKKHGEQPPPKIEMAVGDVKPDGTADALPVDASELAKIRRELFVRTLMDAGYSWEDEGLDDDCVKKHAADAHHAAKIAVFAWTYGATPKQEECDYPDLDEPLAGVLEKPNRPSNKPRFYAASWHAKIGTFPPPYTVYDGVVVSDAPEVPLVEQTTKERAEKIAAFLNSEVSIGAVDKKDHDIAVNLAWDHGLLSRDRDPRQEIPIGYPNPKPGVVAEAAMEAFWKAVADSYPEIKTGDFPPDAVYEFTTACQTAVETWVTFNKPE